jgi:hypothetical protein
MSKCVSCGSQMDLQFAHIKKTNLSGRSRGLVKRYLDITQNPDCYTILCGNHKHSCHILYDNNKIKIDETKTLISILPPYMIQKENV